MHIVLDYIFEILYVEMLSYLTDNEMSNLVYINKSFSSLIQKNGFRRKIHWNGDYPYHLFIKYFNQHLSFINHITLSNLIDPFVFIPVIKPQLSLINCANLNTVVTYQHLKVLTLIDVMGPIPWDKLPQLEECYLFGNIDLTGISNCKKLRIIHYMNKKGTIDINNLKKLNKLTEFKTNCDLCNKDPTLNSKVLQLFEANTQSIKLKSHDLQFIDLGHKYQSYKDQEYQYFEISNGCNYDCKYGCNYDCKYSSDNDSIEIDYPDEEILIA